MSKEQDANAERLKIIERHIQTVVSTLAIAIMLWMGSTLVEVQKDVAVLTSQNTQVISMQTIMQGLVERVAVLESRVRGIETLEEHHNGP